MDDLNLYDDKEFYIHPNQPDMFIPYTSEIEANKKSLNILVREWNGETWAFGPIKEIQVPRNMKSSDFGKYIQEKLFPNIAVENLFGTKISFLKSF